MDFSIADPLFLTLNVTGYSLILQLMIGIPVGVFLAGEKNLFTGIIDFTVTLPMIFPPMALGFFLLILFGRHGILGNFLMNIFEIKVIFSFWGILTATFLVGFPFIVKSVQSSRESFDNSLIEAAATLGKSDSFILIFIILPNIKNGIITGLLLSFCRSLGEVGISLMLGGNIVGKTETLSLAIYNAVYDGNFQKAANLSIILSVIASAVSLCLNVLKKENHNSGRKSTI